MDLVLPDALPSDDERTAVDAVLGPATSGWSGGERAIEFEGRVARGGEARDRRHLLLPVLHALQARAGWISPGGLRYACERLTVPPAEAYGVATFYAMFSTEERPARSFTSATTSRARWPEPRTSSVIWSESSAPNERTNSSGAHVSGCASGHLRR